jgi:hypothetical protein
MMKKSFYNNTNNLIQKRSQNIINLDNKNVMKYNEPKCQPEKKELLTKKNLIKKNFNTNNNIKPRQIKTAKGSPLSINNKILKQITKIKNKQSYQNIDNIPTVIFNVNSKQIFDSNFKKNKNISESKSKSKSNNKSKSNESNKNKIINNNKSSNQCNLVKKNIKNENNFNGNIIKTKTLIQKRQSKNINNNNLQKNLINKNQINNNSYNNNKNKNNAYNFYYNNQKINIGTSLSISSNKNNLIGLQYINNLINKNNLNNYKTTPITTNNSIK